MRGGRGGNMVQDQQQLQQPGVQQTYGQQQMNQQPGSYANQQQSTAFSNQQQQSTAFGNQQQQPNAFGNQSGAFGGQTSAFNQGPFGGQQQAFSGQNSQQYGTGQTANRLQHKGPQVVPTLANSMGMGQQQAMQQQVQQQQNASGQNLMQKLNEITAPGGDILSKGKELIFMKFGLGGK